MEAEGGCCELTYQGQVRAGLTGLAVANCGKPGREIALVDIKSRMGRGGGDHLSDPIRPVRQARWSP